MHEFVICLRDGLWGGGEFYRSPRSVSAPLLYLEAGAGGCVVNCLRNYTFKQVKPIWKNIQGNFESRVVYFLLNIVIIYLVTICLVFDSIVWCVCIHSFKMVNQT